MIRNLFLLFLLCLPFGSFAQPNFHPDDRDWAHYVFILDKTGSMDGGKALNQFKHRIFGNPQSIICVKLLRI